MKTLTKLAFLTAVAAAAFATPALQAEDAPAAPPPPPPAANPPPSRMEQRAERRLKFLDEKLKFSDDQKAKVKAIFDQERQQMRDLRQDDQADHQAMRQRARKIMKGTHEQLRSLLTPDQQKIFDSLQHQGRPPHKDGGQA